MRGLGKKQGARAKAKEKQEDLYLCPFCGQRRKAVFFIFPTPSFYALTYCSGCSSQSSFRI